VLKTRLRKAEQEWMAALRDLEYEHEFILEHAKLLPVTEYPDWVEDDHTWDQASCLQALACSAWLVDYPSKSSRSLHFYKQVKQR
jgi:hypothetical protein